MVADLTMFCVKLSTLLFYLKLFTRVQKLTHIVYFIMAVQALFCLAATGVTVSLLLICTAKHGSTQAFCTQTYKLIIVQRVFGVLTDFLVLGIPIKVVTRLPIPIRQKISLTAIFMTGFL